MRTEGYTDIKPLVNSTLKMFKRVVRLGAPEEVSAKVIDLFCDFIRTEFNKYFPELRALFSQSDELKPATSEDELLQLMQKVNLYDSSEDAQKQIKKIAKDKMRAFMEVLAEVDNFDKMLPEKVQLATQVAQQMLANSDEVVQKFAVDTLSSLQDHVKHNLKTLQSLAGKTVSRDLLPSIDLGAVPAGERANLLNAVLLLLYGRLTKKKGKRAKSHKHDMTTQIFNFISALPKEEVLVAVSTFLSKYQLASPTSSVELGRTIARLPFNKMRGLCYTIKLIIKHLGRLVDDAIPYLGQIVVWILRLSMTYHAKDKSSFFRKVAHTIYIEAIKRLKDIYTQYNETEFLDPITAEFVALLKDKITNMKSELSQGKSNLLSIFLVWSTNPKRLQQNFIKFPFIFDSLFDLLTAPKLTSEVSSCLFQILANLLAGSPEERVCTALFHERIAAVIACIHTHISRLDEEHKGQNSNVFASLSELVGYLSGSQEDSIIKLISLLTPHMFKAARSKRGGDKFIQLVRTLKVLFAKQTQGKGKLQFFTQFAPLMLRTRGFSMRSELAELLAILADENKEVEKYAKAAQLMNTFARSKDMHI